MKYVRLAVFIVSFVLPISVSADILINEIAWMGTSVSANDEWIEVYNSGSDSVDLAGWVLEATDGSPAISLSGEIAGGAYFLLERTDDDSVPGISANQIYTGALANTGEILKLYDDSGSVVDTVDGSGDWSIGGDSVSRKTLQRTNSGWITATPTPKAANESVDSTPDETDDEDSDDPDDSNDDENDSEADDPVDTEIVSETKTDTQKEKKNLQKFDVFKNRKTILAGSPVTFWTEAFDQHNDKLWNVSSIWNFGDGMIVEDKMAVHTWSHPGKYVVAVTVWKGNNEIVQKLTINVREPLVSISDYKAGSGGFIEITNDTSAEVNLSQWSIQSGGNIRMIPHNTFVSSGASVRFYSSALGFIVSGKPILRYPSGDIVEAAALKQQSSPKTISTILNVPLIQTAEASDGGNLNEKLEKPSEFVPEKTSENTDFIWWIIALVALIVVAGIAVVLLTRTETHDDFDTL